MTPIEQAQLLIEKHQLEHTENKYAKKAAQITVNEILNSKFIGLDPQDFTYWSEVLEQLKK